MEPFIVINGHQRSYPFPRNVPRRSPRENYRLRLSEKRARAQQRKAQLHKESRKLIHLMITGKTRMKYPSPLNTIRSLLEYKHSTWEDCGRDLFREFSYGRPTTNWPEPAANLLSQTFQRGQATNLNGRQAYQLFVKLVALLLDEEHYTNWLETHKEAA